MSPNHYQQQQQQQTQFKAHGPPLGHHHPVKVAQVAQNQNNTSNASNNGNGPQVQRKLSIFFCVYAILILALYLTYAAYYYYHQYQNQQTTRQKQQQPIATSELLVNQQQQQQPDSFEPWKQELEARFMFVEKLVNVLTLELQETQRKLAEREKCDCAMSCTFNGTRYNDRSSWQNQCDTCTCQSGRISCLPRKCPQTTCDDPIQLPGQCCPICMKRCKHNATVIKHGQKFTPQDASKECKCQDGRIVCEAAQRRQLAGAIRSAANLSATNNSSTTAPIKTAQIVKATEIGQVVSEQQRQRRNSKQVNSAESESLKAGARNQMSHLALAAAAAV